MTFFLEGWDGRKAQEGDDLCTHIADSRHRTAETNTTLQSTHPPNKNQGHRPPPCLPHSLSDPPPALERRLLTGPSPCPGPPSPLPASLVPLPPLPFSASSPACISILPGPASPPRSHLAGVGRPRHLSPVGRSGSQLPRDSSFYARGGEAGGGKPEETRPGEGVGGERRSGVPAHRRGFSSQDKVASRKEDFSARFPRRPRNPRCLLRIYPRTPSPPPPGVGVGGEGAVDGAWGGGVF